MTTHLMHLAAATHAHRVNGGAFGIGLLAIGIALFWPENKDTGSKKGTKR